MVALNKSRKFGTLLLLLGLVLYIGAVVRNASESSRRSLYLVEEAKDPDRVLILVDIISVNPATRQMTAQLGFRLVGENIQQDFMTPKVNLKLLVNNITGQQEFDFPKGKRMSRIEVTFPKVRVRLVSELTRELFNRLLTGELDVAVVLLPEGKTAPPPLLTKIIARDRMEIVQGAAGNFDGNWKSLGSAPWVLNPPGCPLRAKLLDRMELDGFTPMIAAEVHNMHLQLAFVQSGYGLGLLPARFIARNHSIDAVKVLRPPSFELHPSVAIVRAGQLGALGKAVELLEHEFRQLLEAADTTKPVTRHRRGLPANRRKSRLRK
jgi:hypothetical protein